MFDRNPKEFDYRTYKPKYTKPKFYESREVQRQIEFIEFFGKMILFTVIIVTLLWR